MRPDNPLSPFLDKSTETLDGKFMMAESIEGIIFVKVWTKRFPEGKIFQFYMNLQSAFVLLDDKDEFWFYSALLKKPLKKHGFLALKCSRYCGIRRFSIQCLFSCRKRRIINGEPINPERIHLRINPLFMGKKLGILRRFIIDKLQSIERMLNYG